MPRFRNALLLSLLACLIWFAVGCGDDESPTKPPTPIPIGSHTVTTQNANFNNRTGRGYVNLYDGFAYADQNAVNNAYKIDFRHQYRGNDIANLRMFENMTTASRWDVTSLFDGITPTESQIGLTMLREAEFDAINSQQELLASFDFTSGLSHSVYIADIDGNILAKVFAFTDKNGKRGLFKVTSAYTGAINTTPAGDLTIEIKIEL